MNSRAHDGVAAQQSAEHVERLAKEAGDGLRGTNAALVGHRGVQPQGVARVAEIAGIVGADLGVLLASLLPTFIAARISKIVSSVISL
jgi:hypothetical protein